jgi:hypothetical protein
LLTRNHEARGALPGGRAEEEQPMTVDQVVAAHERYRRDGFCLCPEPVLPAHVVEQAVAGMDALRAGEYDTGRPPRPSAWNPGDDPNLLCKIEMRTGRSDRVHR